MSIYFSFTVLEMNLFLFWPKSESLLLLLYADKTPETYFYCQSLPASFHANPASSFLKAAHLAFRDTHVCDPSSRLCCFSYTIKSLPVFTSLTRTPFALSGLNFSHCYLREWFLLFQPQNLWSTGSFRFLCMFKGSQTLSELGIIPSFSLMLFIHQKK